MYRTKTNGELNLSNVNETVELSGWIQKIRNLGGMVFIDLRDHKQRNFQQKVLSTYQVKLWKEVIKIVKYQQERLK